MATLQAALETLDLDATAKRQALEADLHAKVAELEAKVAAATQHKELEASRLNGKVVELQQSLRVRFGVMLVGPAAGGKSCARRALQAALGALAARGAPVNAATRAAVSGCVTPNQSRFMSNIAWLVRPLGQGWLRSAACGVGSKKRPRAPRL